MKLAIFVTLLHGLTIHIEGSRWFRHKANENNEVALRKALRSPLSAPLIIFMIEQEYNPDNTIMRNDQFSAYGRQPKHVARAHIREIQDIRHDPAFSSHYYMQRRLQRCHIRRRLCIYGECSEVDIECIHVCRVKFNACYRLPTFDAEFPAFPKISPASGEGEEDVTFDSIMEGNINKL